jgi:hypothetical protein
MSSAADDPVLELIAFSRFTWSGLRYMLVRFFMAMPYIHHNGITCKALNLILCIAPDFDRSQEKSGAREKIVVLFVTTKRLTRNTPPVSDLDFLRFSKSAAYGRLLHNFRNEATVAGAWPE